MTGTPYGDITCNFTRDVQKAVDFEMRVAEIHAKRAADLLDNCGNVALFNTLQEDVMRGIKHIRSVCAPECKQVLEYNPAEKEMTDENKKTILKADKVLKDISESLDLMQHELAKIEGYDNIAYGPIARAMGNVGEALCEIKKEQEKDQ